MESILSRLSQAVAASSDLESLTRPILELLEAVTGLPSTYLTMVDEPAGVQRILFSRNTGTMTIPEGLAVPWGDTLCKRALEEGRAYTGDVGACWGDSQAARELGIQTYLSQPVRTVDGGLFGTLCAASPQSVGMKPDTMSVLAMFARLIAQQVERERALRDMREANARLSSQSLADPLTGIANRRAMEQGLDRMLAQAQRDGTRVQVAYVDLDGFKAVNDTWGHEAGDRFLIHIAGRLATATRPSDLVARTGGDEFVVLAPSAADAGLRERLEQATVGPFAHGQCRIDYAGASVGVAWSNPGETDGAALLRRADAAMYAQKSARRAAAAGVPRRAPAAQPQPAHRG